MRRAAILLIFSLLTACTLAAKCKSMGKDSPKPTATSWYELGESASGGGISGTSTVSAGPVLALDHQGNPIVAWMNRNSGNYEIYVRKWDGAKWAEMGIGSATGGGISNNPGDSKWPSMALDYEGNPIVAWEDDSSGKRKIYVKKYDGAAWVEIAGSASGNGISGSNEESQWPSLAINSAGNPVVAWWAESKGVNLIFIKQYDGAQWAGVGGSGGGSGISRSGESSSPSLALDSADIPAVAWTNRYRDKLDIYVRKWGGKSWSEIGKNSASTGGISRNYKNSGLPCLRFAPSGLPIVAWEDDGSGNNEIYVLKFDGENWVEMGQNSASAGGISDDLAESKRPSMAIGRDGLPVIAWEDEFHGNREIFVKRWNGSAWVETGAGSASDGGVSSNVGESESPSVAVDFEGNPVVAWRDKTSGNWQIYLRKFTPPAPENQ